MDKQQNIKTLLISMYIEVLVQIIITQLLFFIHLLFIIQNIQVYNVFVFVLLNKQLQYHIFVLINIL